MSKIHFANVIQVEKTKVFGMFNSGLMIQQAIKGGQKIARYQLGGFADRNHAFSRIVALWKRHAPKAAGNISSGEAPAKCSSYLTVDETKPPRS